MKDKDFENQELSADHSAERTFTDFKELLTIAEKWQDQCDEADTIISRTRLTQFILGTVAAIIGSALQWIANRIIEMPNLEILIWVSASIIFIILIWLSGSSSRKIKRRKLRDQHAMYEIVELLREIEGTLAKKEQWSPLERAQFRIRLSRFDIGPSYNHSRIEDKGINS